MDGSTYWVTLPILTIVSSILLHFGLGFIVGLLVYLLTSTILLHFCLKLGMEDFSIHITSLLLALSFSAVVHIWQDYTLRLF